MTEKDFQAWLKSCVERPGAEDDDDLNRGYEYYYVLTSEDILDLNALNTLQPLLEKSLPGAFAVSVDEKRLKLTISHPTELPIDVVEREVDRISFLVGIKFNIVPAGYCDPDGIRCANPELDLRVTVYDASPLLGIGRQQWTPDLSLQLALWRLAMFEAAPLAARINLLFQIIESKYPNPRNKNDYPKYNDSSQPPDPRTECKLLRHLVSHQGAPKREVATYYKFLGLPAPARFYDPTDLNYRASLGSRMHVIQEQAKQVIYEVITRI